MASRRPSRRTDRRTAFPSQIPVAWHGAKWRLCSQLCSPWEIGKPRKDAGVLELVALIARYARDDPGEVVPKAVQDADLTWLIR